MGETAEPGFMQFYKTFMSDFTDRETQIQRLRDIVKSIDIGMLTTVDEDGSLRSRPMATNQHIEFDGDLWFFTYAGSHKVLEVEQHQQVNVSYSDPKSQRYVSMTGMAQLVRDRHKMQELWQPSLKTWFPKGLDEPDLALLKVDVEGAEYWDAPSGWVAHTVGFVKSIASGKKGSVGEHQTINLA